MSLYDKYHSNHNKQYMYNLISDIIVKEGYNQNFKNNNLYNEIMLKILFIIKKIKFQKIIYQMII